MLEGRGGRSDFDNQTMGIVMFLMLSTLAKSPGISISIVWSEDGTRLYSPEL